MAGSSTGILTEKSSCKVSEFVNSSAAIEGDLDKQEKVYFAFDPQNCALGKRNISRPRILLGPTPRSLGKEEGLRRRPSLFRRNSALAREWLNTVRHS